MQIFYVTIMLVVFVLCFVLFTTARRVLRGSPLQSGELGLPRFAGFANNSEAPAPLRWQSDASEEEIPERSDVPMSAESFIEKMKSAERPSTQFAEQSVSAEDVYGAGSASDRMFSEADVSALSAPDPVPAKGRAGTVMPKRKLSTPAYTYMLEMLLIGVSVVVLVRTQRSTARYRVPQASRGKVA